MNSDVMDGSGVISSVDSTGDLKVLSFRMGSVESSIKELSNKFDTFANDRPTQTHVDLIIQPLRDDVNLLKLKDQERERQKDRDNFTIRLAFTMALVGPIVSVIITTMVVK